MANYDQLVAQVSHELLEELTEGGTRDFTQTRLSQMEAEVYGLADRISERLLHGMLSDQSQQADAAEGCPCCQTPLEGRPPDTRPIQVGRCKVQWDKPVKRCPKCRRDFFPSGGDDGDAARSDL
jgi:uncharacterized protein with PIN domain